MDDQYQKAFDDFTKRYEKSVSEYQKRLDLSIKRFEEKMNKALGLAEQQEPQIKEQDKPPAAVWTESDGEKLLILNQNAAVMFMAIFDRLDGVLKEMQKLAPGKR